MFRDMERLCLKYGFVFRHPTVFPRNSLLCTRISLVLTRLQTPWATDLLRHFSINVFKANFAEDKDISKLEIAQEALQEALDAASKHSPAVRESIDSILKEARSSQVIKTQLRADIEKAQGYGIFGAPSFIIGNELFWGNDRIEDALELAKSHENTSGTWLTPWTHGFLHP